MDTFQEHNYAFYIGLVRASLFKDVDGFFLTLSPVTSCYMMMFNIYSVPQIFCLGIVGAVGSNLSHYDMQIKVLTKY